MSHLKIKKTTYPVRNQVEPAILTQKYFIDVCVNPLNAELNPICHLLALLGAHHILHVSRIRVNSLPMESLGFFIGLTLLVAL
jgi:hypothetical protein